MGSGYTEALTISTDTGVPIRFVGGPPNGPASSTVTYGVTRVDTTTLVNRAG